MHTFEYEVEFRKTYSVCHSVFKSAILADDWHAAVTRIQSNTLPLLDGIIIKITLIKEV